MTQNPLVISQNLTMIFDHRIFSSDGNVIIKAYALLLPTLLSLVGSDFPCSMQGATFTSTCSSLLECMINTVLSSVSLSKDPIKAAAYKLMWVFTSPVGKDSNSGEAPTGGKVGDIALKAQVRVRRSPYILFFSFNRVLNRFSPSW
jgi:hypothetical protein